MNPTRAPPLIATVRPSVPDRVTKTEASGIIELAEVSATGKKQCRVYVRVTRLAQDLIAISHGKGGFNGESIRHEPGHSC